MLNIDKIASFCVLCGRHMQLTLNQQVSYFCGFHTHQYLDSCRFFRHT